MTYSDAPIANVPWITMAGTQEQLAGVVKETR